MNDDLEAISLRAMLREHDRRIIAAETAIADHKAATLHQRKQLTLLRVKARRLARRLERISQ